MACGWGGNRRSGVALAMRHRLQWFIHLRAHGLRKGDEHSAYTPRGVWHSFTFPLRIQPLGGQVSRGLKVKVIDQGQRSTQNVCYV